MRKRQKLHKLTEIFRDFMKLPTLHTKTACNNMKLSCYHSVKIVAEQQHRHRSISPLPSQRLNDLHSNVINCHNSHRTHKGKGKGSV